MSKKLYEEALADMKSVKAAAEADARRAIIEAVTPRIRALIERELLKEGDGEDVDGNVLKDDSVVLTVDAKETVPASEACNAASEHDGEYEVNLESVNALEPIVKAIGESSRNFDRELQVVAETISNLGNVADEPARAAKINEMISRVNDMYDYVQEKVGSGTAKALYETRLETFFDQLKKLEEMTMAREPKNVMNEEDVTLKLTGLPDDTDLDSIGVDLITGDEEAGAEGDADGNVDPDAGDDVGFDLDALGADDEGAGDDEEMQEVRNLSDDTIVEIDEKMLKNAVASMRRARRMNEEAVPSVDGNGVGSKEFDDFGGGSDAGEPLDTDLSEADDQLEEQDQDQLDEQDLDQIGDERTRDDFGGSATSMPSMDNDNPANRCESLRRRLAFEAKLRARAKTAMQALKRGPITAEAKARASHIAKCVTDSLKRTQKFSRLVAEAQRLQMQHQNGAAVVAENAANSELRRKLAETNLINAKLVFTNKLMQNEALSSKQKARVIAEFDSARTVREVQLVYKSLSGALGATQKSLTESAGRIGSSSRPTLPGSSQVLSEAYEAERWAKLAGISK